MAGARTGLGSGVALALAAALAGLGGCQRVGLEIDFERMIDQAKFEAYERGLDRAERGVMRRPPIGAVPRERILDPRLAARIGPTGRERDDVPIRVDRPLLERGRDRFERYCAACHGVAGFGNAQVVENMALRPAPSLHTPMITEQPPGRIFATITHGFGLMPSYATELDPRDRWAVVAYLRALWLSQSAQLDRLPEPVRVRARQELP